jgi:purine-nucleoside phosphorylase
MAEPTPPAAPSRGDGLILAAFPPELAGLEAHPPPGWRVGVCGIGAVTAAATTARLLAERPASRVVLIGTCGAYDGRLAIGDLVAVSTAIATSLDELGGRADRPSLEAARWEATLRLPFPAHPVAVTPGITVDPAGAAALARLAAAEHLEVTGVFAAASAAGVPVGALLGVANRVGPSAHAEWQAHHARVSAALVEALVAALPGL